MRIAILSDIHANYEALSAAIEDIDRQRIDEVVCLGDIVGYGANPNECVNLIKQRCRLTILGNHDAAAMGMLSTHNFNFHAKLAIEWTTEHLNTESKAFLNVLPLKEKQYGQTFVHSTPYEPNMWHYITSLEEAAFNFQFFDTEFCFVGHTHIPVIIVVNERNELYLHNDAQIKYKNLNNSRFLINVGSAGQPRDHDSRSCYGILDTDAKYYFTRRVKYDLTQCQEKMRSIHMPEFLISRLEEGR
ncbi:MAG: metallophosphoesterase [Chitinivibrionales bacterium]|nr:metallophosphoesterase [Chitinivibrionales bacterium]